MPVGDNRETKDLRGIALRETGSRVPSWGGLAPYLNAGMTSRAMMRRLRAASSVGIRPAGFGSTTMPSSPSSSLPATEAIACYARWYGHRLRGE